MKHLKMSMMLLLTVAIFTSCEKETMIVAESAEVNNEMIEINSFKSLIELKESDIDIQSYMNSLSKQGSITTKQAVSQRTEDTGLQFFSSAEDFPCSNLPTEDFEKANILYGGGIGIPSNLNEYTDNLYFSPGDILPGISFSTLVNFESPESIALLGENFAESGNPSKSIFANIGDGLVINFTGNEVTSVSMDILTFSVDGDVTIEVFGNSGSLGSTTVYSSKTGTFWGVNSDEAIVKITIFSEGFFEGIDNISFGVCDTDGDGVSDDKDPYPNSNLSETINIGENYLDIENVFTAEGTTMMDQIDALIAEINAQYDGENWDELHRDFTRGIAKITYYWRKDRLITRGERSDISSAAWSANIPYFNERD